MKILLLLVLLPISAFAQTDRNYEGVKTFLTQLAAKYPKTVRPIVVGDSDSGEKIQGVRIGDGPVHTLVVSTHHGNEYGSTEVALAFAESVAANPIAGQSTYVIPVLNIGGYNKRSRYEATATGHSSDPNRDYPGPCGTEGPFSLKSTKALADFVDHEKIVSSATLHTYFPAVVYPWGIPTKDLSTAYDDIFKGIVETATTDSHYQTGNSTEVMYPVGGAFEDYAYWKHGIWSILFELGFSHYPSDEQLQSMIDTNVPGLRRMLEKAPTNLAANHAFAGKCDYRLQSLDRHDE
ncbi:MAG: M14 family zinc carboxypeptidase [Bdellovibrionota bacterium]